MPTGRHRAGPTSMLRNSAADLPPRRMPMRDSTDPALAARGYTASSCGVRESWYWNVRAVVPRRLPSMRTSMESPWPIFERSASGGVSATMTELVVRKSMTAHRTPSMKSRFPPGSCEKLMPRTHSRVPPSTEPCRCPPPASFSALATETISGAARLMSATCAPLTAGAEHRTHRTAAETTRWRRAMGWGGSKAWWLWAEPDDRRGPRISIIRDGLVAAVDSGAATSCRAPGRGGTRVVLGPRPVLSRRPASRTV
mmetsp:Transcript_37964/g.94099  ORF Transcript_37964/g.94099 Transcript_37964/m.94099 type:complete len:255 (+) Transcript_37964:9380-10144(+)